MIENDSNLKHKFNEVGIPDFYNDHYNMWKLADLCVKLCLCLVVTSTIDYKYYKYFIVFSIYNQC